MPRRSRPAEPRRWRLAQHLRSFPERRRVGAPSKQEGRVRRLKPGAGARPYVLLKTHVLFRRPVFLQFLLRIFLDELWTVSLWTIRNLSSEVNCFLERGSGPGDSGDRWIIETEAGLR